MTTNWSQTLSEWREDIYFIISNTKGSEKAVGNYYRSRGVSS